MPLRPVGETSASESRPELLPDILPCLPLIFIDHRSGYALVPSWVNPGPVELLWCEVK